MEPKRNSRSSLDLYSLNGELADSGVYAGTLTVSAVIDGSELADFGRKWHADAADADTDAPTATEIPSVDPDDLAECYWDMYTHRDRVEEARPATPVSRAGGAVGGAVGGAAGGAPLLNLGLDTAPACTDGVCAL
ncbi:hypothetical protein [Streptomyces milbemycinicus]|uniref:Uncharacterized protein n=1 Tax=Streptomyces milbemycinicus TaxID=476552 RepID=A0ABW8LCB1_9ACTN